MRDWHLIAHQEVAGNMASINSQSTKPPGLRLGSISVWIYGLPTAKPIAEIVRFWTNRNSSSPSFQTLTSSSTANGPFPVRLGSHSPPIPPSAIHHLSFSASQLFSFSAFQFFLLPSHPFQTLTSSATTNGPFPVILGSHSPPIPPSAIHHLSFSASQLFSFSSFPPKLSKLSRVRLRQTDPSR